MDLSSSAGASLGSVHRTLREQVEDELRLRIVTGRYAPGERLVEEQVAVDLGVSRNPVREALRSLVAQGFVAVVPRRGAVVRRLGRQDVDDLFDVRGSLESLAARHAAERGGPEVAARLRGLLEEARGASDRHDYDRLAELNSAFHGEVVALSGNALLQQIVHGLAWRTRWLFRRSASTRAPHSWAEHLALVDAIAAGDPDRAARLAGEHVEAARASALEALGESRHRPTA